MNFKKQLLNIFQLFLQLTFHLSLPTDCTCQSRNVQSWHVKSWHVQSVPSAHPLFVMTRTQKFNSSKNDVRVFLCSFSLCLRTTVPLKIIKSRDWYPCFPWLTPLKIKAYFEYLRQRSKMTQQGFPRVYASNVTHGKVMKFREVFEHRSLTTKEKQWHLNGSSQLPGPQRVW